MIDDTVPAGIDAPRVTGWFRDNIEGATTPLRFERVPGGHSCLTYVVTGGDGRRYVLRRPPIGHTLATAHDVAREHRIISALADSGVPVAPALGLCRDPSVNEADFYVMAFVDGIVLHDSEAARRLAPEARRRAGEHLVDILVALHALAPDDVGLGDLSKRSDYAGRQLRRWAAQWEGSKTTERPGMDRLHEWLVAHQPADTEARIVHGDFRLGNAIHAADGTVLAMLDWELCTLGEPLADVSYLLRSWSDPDEPERASADPPTRAGGFPGRDELVARYASRSGRDVSELSYWLAFNAWRSACIVQGVYARYLKGMMAASPTEDFDRFERGVVEGMHAGLEAAGL